MVSISLSRFSVYKSKIFSLFEMVIRNMILRFPPTFSSCSQRAASRIKSIDLITFSVWIPLASRRPPRESCMEIKSLSEFQLTRFTQCASIISTNADDVLLSWYFDSSADKKKILSPGSTFPFVFCSFLSIFFSFLFSVNYDIHSIPRTYQAWSCRKEWFLYTRCATDIVIAETLCCPGKRNGGERQNIALE